MASGRRGSIDETTAGEACAEAPNEAVAKQVEETANLEHEAAEQAASVAKELGPKYTGEPVSAVGKLGMEASQILDKAVEEGKRDVAGGGKAIGAEGSGNIKETAAKVHPASQEHLSFGAGESQGEQKESDFLPPGVSQAAVMDMLKSIADSGRTAIRKTDEAVAGAAQSVVGTTGTQGAQVKEMPASSTGIPAVGQPLQTGSKVVESIYPKAGAGHEAKDVAQNEPSKASK